MAGNDSIYLDNSATTRPFDCVIAEMAAAMADGWHNPSAAYAPGAAAQKRLDAVRAVIAAAAGGAQVVFTSGGTEADNLALFGAPKGRHTGLITSAVEHPAVLRAAEHWQSLGHSVTVLPVDGTGAVDSDALAEALDERTGLVSIMHVNNETGVVNDIAALSTIVRQRAPQALFHADGVQAFLRVPLDMGSAGVDLYSVSAHKIHGPKGSGALILRRGVGLNPVAHGGGQEGGLRSGTENTPGILGFGRAVEEYSKGLPERIALMRQIKLALASELLQIPDAAVNGPAPEAGAPHILNISFPGVRGEVLLRALSERGIYVSTGSACGARKVKLSPVLLAMGLGEKRAEGAIRLSSSTMNTMEEAGRVCEAIRAEVLRLRRFQRR